jgi:alpha-tubulin suppressor-like RCC1 family protein
VNVQGFSEGVGAMAAGHSHTCVVIPAGKVQYWGYASHGQLGDGVASRFPFPVKMLGFAGLGNTHLLLPMRGR